MRMTRTKLVMVAPLLAVLSIVTVAATTPSAGTRRVIEDQHAAKEWVAAHINALPTRLEAVSMLPKAYQHELMPHLTWAERGQLWKDHLAIFLKPEAELSASEQPIVKALGAPLADEQRTFIRSARARLDSIFGPDLSDDQRQALAKPICDSAKILFAKAQGSLIFGRLGVPSQSSASAPQQATMGAEFVVGMVRVVLTKVHLTRTLGACQCNTGSLCDCDADVWCSQGSPCVIQIIPECGCFMIWSCNGLCPD